MHKIYTLVKTISSLIKVIRIFKCLVDFSFLYFQNNLNTKNQWLKVVRYL